MCNYNNPVERSYTGKLWWRPVYARKLKNFFSLLHNSYMFITKTIGNHVDKAAENSDDFTSRNHVEEPIALSTNFARRLFQVQRAVTTTPCSVNTQAASMAACEFWRTTPTSGRSRPRQRRRRGQTQASSKRSGESNHQQACASKQLLRRLLDAWPQR